MAEGMKFSAEDIKFSFNLNGAASVAVLTFPRHTGTVTANLVGASLGALAVTFCYEFAYKTELQYGNDYSPGRCI